MVQLHGKNPYRKSVISALHKENERMLIHMAYGKEKCNRILNEEYGRKYYFFEKNLQEARIFFKTRVSMLPFAGNFSNDRRFAKTSWLCLCGSKEEEKHLTSGRCSVYGDLVGQNMNFNDDTTLVKLFLDILERRDELEEKTNIKKKD